jgi:hypothetical protein
MTSHPTGLLTIILGLIPFPWFQDDASVMKDCLRIFKLPMPISNPKTPSRGLPLSLNHNTPNLIPFLSLMERKIFGILFAFWVQIGL